MLKKSLSILLALALSVGLLPGAALAEDDGIWNGIIDVEPSVMELFIQSVDLMSLDDEGKVPLKDSIEVNWIDRLDLTGEDYAMPFYNWLAENSDGDGVDDALIIPSMGERNDSMYYHTITEFGAEIPFTFGPDASSNEIKQAAIAAATQEINARLSTVSAFTYEVLHAFDRDHPEVFWLSKQAQITAWGGATQYKYEDSADGCGTVSYTLSVRFVLKSGGYDIRTEDAEDILKDIAERDTAVEEILSGLSPEASRYEQIRYLNDWLTKNNGYNTSPNLNTIDEECYECISALEGESGKDGPVCEGYARALKVLCDKLGIPCVLVDGICNGGGHMWNYVQMEDSQWYAVDVTWNDPVVAGIFSALSGYEREDYLLVGGETVISEEAFLQSHPVSNRPSYGATTPAYLNGPVLSETAFDPTAHIHEYDYTNVVFEWTEDYSGCTASVTCLNCEEDEEGHTLTAECTVTSTGDESDKMFTATADLNGVTVETCISVHIHSYGDPVFEWTEDYSGCTASVTCPNCEEDAEGHTLTAECTVTSDDDETGTTFTATTTLNGEEVSAETRVAAQISGDEVIVTLPAGAEQMTVIIAYYNSEHKMIDCELITAPEEDIHAAIKGQSVVVFFLSNDETPHPLLSALQAK